MLLKELAIALVYILHIAQLYILYCCWEGDEPIYVQYANAWLKLFYLIRQLGIKLVRGARRVLRV